MVRINETLSIPDEEFEFSFARSGGPGGQKVNKTSTKVVVRFNLAGSPSLSDAQKQQVMEKLANRIDAEGFLMVASQETRSQLMNREAGVARLASLLEQALKVRKRRRKTRVPRAAVERRLESKHRQSARKRERSGASGNVD